MADEMQEQIQMNTEGQNDSGAQTSGSNAVQKSDVQDGITESVKCVQNEAVENERPVIRGKHRKPRKLFWLLLRNTIMFWSAALLILGLIIYFTWKYPVLYRNTCHTVQNLDEMQQWYDEQCYNVSYHAVNLKYTGYDYYENDRLTGAYYYTFEGDRCLFVLIKSKKPHSVINTAVIRGKLIKDSAHMEAVLDQFASDVGIERKAFFQVVYPLMISEIDYPWTQTILMWVLVILPAILTAIVLFLGIEWTIRPYMHPNMKQLDEYGNRKYVYYEINAQLNRDSVMHQDHYYFTEDYLIFDNIGYLEFVRIDKVRYISKHAAQDKKKGQKYRLTMSDDEKIYFEKDFKSEPCVDAIMKEMITRNDQIDDRTLHVFHLPTEESEQSEADILTDIAQMDTSAMGVSIENGSLKQTEQVVLSGQPELAEQVVLSGQPDTPEQLVQQDLMDHVTATDAEASPVGINDEEDLKIYNVRRRLRKKDADIDQVKIYNVRRRLRRNRQEEKTDSRKS